MYLLFFCWTTLYLLYIWMTHIPWSMMTWYQFVFGLIYTLIQYFIDLHIDLQASHWILFSIHSHLAGRFFTHLFINSFIEPIKSPYLRTFCFFPYQLNHRDQGVHNPLTHSHGKSRHRYRQSSCSPFTSPGALWMAIPMRKQFEAPGGYTETHTRPTRSPRWETQIRSSFVNRQLCVQQYNNILAFQGEYKRNDPLPLLSVSILHNGELEEV